ncbi:helix-turn-helix domain-containing protein [Cellulosilyticum lentocellum]|uniref:Helix-turn-helix domain protein n=1 Tax=Cellulosilyticum lentocellum (strain ATCC 49066 / DSM 5427 / NCIMB 11756 / RHM5) TaxID=642492 RepID=F2JIG1_CELLD|nr:helix-turn-helix transcriptional regulator [Cellulosilyticum lentocellum]ADZ84327.1 helix-turn-helix domain protein [Cellulosilyticum lentocellum DSM 5427]
MKIDTHKLSVEIARNCFSAEELSKCAGISRVTLQRLKSGRQVARPQTIGKLAKALEVKVEDLLKEE